MNRRDFITAVGMLPLSSLGDKSLKFKREQGRDKLHSFIKVIYGVSSKREPFLSIPIKKISEWLNTHGINAVFTRAEESLELLQTLNKENIFCFQEITIFSGKSLYQNNPAWRPVTSKGEEMKPDGWYHGLCPNQPDLRKKRLLEFEKRLDNPCLNGIWLDFIRYPVHWEKKNPRFENTCFCPVCLKQFQDFANIDLLKGSVESKSGIILKKYSIEWQLFRIQSICSFVKEVMQLRDQKRPDILLGLFLVPWLEQDFNNAIIQSAAQDVNRLAPLVDVFSPMVYHLLCFHDLNWIETVTKAVREQSQKKVWPIIQTMSDPSPLSAEEFIKSMRIAGNTSESGVILFTVDGLQKEKRWDEVKAVWK